MNIVKKVSTAMLTVGMLLPLSSYAVELTDEQTEAVELLTNASVGIINYSKIISEVFVSKGGMGGFSLLAKEQENCLYQAYTNDYPIFQREKTIAYVVANTPQRIEQDMNVLTPNVVSFIHQAMDIGVAKSKGTLGDEAKQLIKDKLINETNIETMMNISLLMKDYNYRGLRSMIGFEEVDESTSLFLLWGMKQCSVDISDLQ